MKKKLIWLALFAATIAFILVFFKETEARIIVSSIFFMVAVHESGHLGMAKYLGYKTGGFYLLPGLGGVALLEEMPEKRWHDFLIFYAGPAVGFLETVLLIAINYLLQIQLLWIMAVLWAVINIFNMLVALPLDGGKIMWAIFGKKDESYFKSLLYYLCTFASLLAILFLIDIFWFVLILILGTSERYSIIKASSFKIPMTSNQKVTALGFYLTLVGGLCLLVFVSFNFLNSTP